MQTLNDIYHYRYEAWVYDQIEPNDRLFVGRRQPKVLPAWAEPFPDHLIKNPPEEIDQVEKDRRQEEYLKKFGL